jgi:P4 family phage/plasmid primase-like protien
METSNINNKCVNDFNDFINNYKIIKKLGDKHSITHTSLIGGSYNIPDNKKSDFFRLYKKVIKSGWKLHISEQHITQAPIIIDVDIKYKISKELSNKRLYNDNHVKKIIELYNIYINEFLKIDKDDKLNVYLMEKEHPTLISEEDGFEIYKDGFHLIYPNLCTKPRLQHILRASILSKLSENNIFFDIKPINTLDDIIDKAVIERNGWMMYGSCKPNCKPYIVTKVYNKDLEIIDYDDDDLIQELSIQRYNSDEITYFNDIWDNNKIDDLYNKIYGRNNKKSKKGTEEDIRIANELVSLLSLKRSDDYTNWIELGFCLHNIDDSLIDLWIEISKNNKKYKEGECENYWKNFKDEGLTIRSLHRWAKLDNPDSYNEFMIKELNEVLKKSTTGTSYDVAKAFYEMYKYQYVVSSITHKSWYYFDNSKWCTMDGAYKIINELNENMVNQYLIMASRYSNMASKANGEDKDRYLKIQEDCLKVSLKIRSSSFKDSVIKELLSLYYDPQFINKLDENRHLICFNNGILDLNTMLFREGRPEDYVSLCTNISYEPYDKSNKLIQDVENFLVEIQPEDNMREYIIRFLSSCIAGHSPDEKIHIWTGSGGNGKSVLVTLMQSCFGDYATTLSISLLTQKRAASNAATPELADTKGKRFAVFQEPDNNDQIHVGHMKELTGNDKIKARKLFKEPIEFIPQFKPVLTCNKLPTIPSTDGGTWRRIRVSPFEMKFVENPVEDYERKIDKKLKEILPSWKEAFMSILVETYKRYKKEGLIEPDKVLEYTKQYEKQSDSLHEFIFGIIGKGEIDDNFNLGELYREFTAWYKLTHTDKCTYNKNDIKYEIEEKLKKKFNKDIMKGYKLICTISSDGNLIKKNESEIDIN